MRGALIFLVLFAVLPDIACGKNCGKMAQDLEQLRQDYHKYATSAPAGGTPITFDGLVAILDKIVTLKHDMEKSNCPVPPRRKASDQKR